MEKERSERVIVQGRFYLQIIQRVLKIRRETCLKKEEKDAQKKILLRSLLTLELKDGHYLLNSC